MTDLFMDTTDINRAMDIFLYLLEHKALKYENNRDLFDDYTKEEIQGLVKNYAQKISANVNLINNTIYLIPTLDSTLISFNKTELKKAMLGSSATQADYYLANFIILTLITSFYSSATAEKTRNFISYAEFENSITDKLAVAKENMDIEQLEKDSGIAFADIIQKWANLKNEETKNQGLTKKKGFIILVMNFLEKQGLAEYKQSEEAIYTIKKLDDLIGSVILNKSNFKNVEDIFRKLRRAENTLLEEVAIDIDYQD
jgi:hypothetical protein